MLHHLHEQVSVLVLLSLVVGIGVGEDVLGVGLESDVGPEVEVLQVFQGGLELMGEEVSVDLDPTVDLYFQSLDEVSKIDLDPCLLNGCLDLCDFDLNLFEVGDLLIEEIEVGDQLTATLQQDILSLHLFLAIDLVYLRLVLLQELAETFFGILLPEVAVLLQVFLDVFGVLDNEIQVVRDPGHGELDKEVGLDFDEIISGGCSAAGSCGGGIESWEVVRNGEDLIDPSLDGIANGLHASFTIEDLRLIHHTSLAL